MNEDDDLVTAETVEEIRVGYDRICEMNESDPDAKLLTMCGLRYSLDLPKLLSYIDQQADELQILRQRYADEQIDALGNDFDERPY